VRLREALPAPSPARTAFLGIFAVTALGLLTIGATLPVLPRYVTGPIGAGDVSVGIVTGAFAVTGLLFRPVGGAFADARGRKPVVVIGALLTALSGAILFVPAGVEGLIVSRLFLGAGEGMVYTAGAAWIVDMAPPARRGRIIGLYGLAIWGGLSLGPPVGEALLRAFDYEVVWAFCVAAPLLGTLIAVRLPERYSGSPPAAQSLLARARALISREALAPGAALALTVVGYATLAAFIVLHLEDRGIGHGALVFTAFATTVVLMRILGGWIPDRIGGARAAAGAALVQAGGLATIGVAETLTVALVGAVAMGAAFALLFPSLALLVLEQVGEDRRGAAMGTFTAFFDVGVGLGAPLAGAVAAFAGYGAAFGLAAALGLGTIAIAYSIGRGARGEPLPEVPG
jgi:MFS family permease